MRRVAVFVLALGLASCGGGEPRTNHPRPPVPVTLTGAIHADSIEISPGHVGAGPLSLVISNQSGRAQRVTMETDTLGSATSGKRAESPVIAADGIGRLTIDADTGHYIIHVGDRRVRVARIIVGPKRKSSQNDLLLP